MRIASTLLLMTSVVAVGIPARSESCEMTGRGVSSALQQPGDVERAATSKVEFLVGEWAGEGWFLSGNGERIRFWVKEVYRYRGSKDLLDMEGRFGDITADGSKSAEQEYALGILSFDRSAGTYQMWHYSSDGTIFTVPMAVDVNARRLHYTRTNPRGQHSRFTLWITEDSTWITQREVYVPDGTWDRTMEFRMKRVVR